jgi:Protein of unknown function (DUF1559)
VPVEGNETLAMRVPRVRITVRRMMMVVAVLALPMSVIHFALNVKEGAREGGCLGQFFQYGLNLLQYQEMTGSLPPAYSLDRAGRRMHSWRAEALRLWADNEISHTYDYLVAWDDPGNAALRSYDTPGHFYWCPSGDSRTTKETDYVAVVGPHTAWPGDRGRRLAEITDERASTILLVEVAASGIHWMEPKDPTLEGYLASGPSSRHPGFFFALFADFRVRRVRKDLDRATLKALLTIDGNETIDPRSWQINNAPGR